MARSSGLFDHLASVYDDVLPYFADFGRQLVAFADPPPGARLLDVGAGTGAVARFALERDCVVTAVDASPGMVRRLAEELPRATTAVMEAEALDVPDSSFDVLTAGFVIHTVDRPIDVLLEARRVVRPGGTVAVSQPGPTQDTARWQGFDAIIARYAPDSSTLSSSTPRVDLVALMGEAGLLDAVVQAAEVHIPVPDPDTVWRWLMSHGFLGFFLSLSPDDQTELQRAVMAELRAMAESSPIVLDRGAVFARATTPSIAGENAEETTRPHR